MKKLLLLTLIVFIGSINAQSYDDASEASELCLLAQGSIGNNFTNDKDADIALEKILAVIGASKRFILQPCSDINNAVATSYKGLRYILYDKSFMSTIANNSTSWSQLFILAHEVGHHINGHSIDILLAAADIVEPKTLATKRKQELESDEFAGFILGKLGATLEQTSEAINLLASNKDDTYSSHPNKSKRLNAIKIGFNKALGKKQVVYEKKTNLNTAEEYFYRAYEKSVKGHYIGAISDYTKAIEINPNYADAYNNRGNNKDDLKDYFGAISDYIKAIEINPNNEDAYYNRGISKYYSKDYNGAISDFTKAIDINPKKADVYNNRGLVKDDLKDYYGAISDYTKAIEINPNFMLAYTGRGNTKTNLKDYNGAISDFTKAIEINPNFASAYFVRGINKYYLNDSYGACVDVKKAQGLGYDDDDVKQLINILCK
jgi:tetratricopeptide (TPR) repeat protein